MDRSLIKGFRKQFGDGSIFTMAGDDVVSHDLGFLPTGNFAIDSIIGRPGIPLGRVTEFYGAYASGKSTTVASILGKCQSIGGLAVLFDTEHAYSPEWSSTYGINPEELLVAQPRCLEDAFIQTAYLCQSILESNFEYPVVIAFDSVSALPLKAELDDTQNQVEGKKDEKGVRLGGHAAYMSRALRVLTDTIHEAAVCLVMVSQMKQNPMGYGVQKLGGEALNFHAAIQIKLSKVQPKTAEYASFKATCVKNKVSSPFKEAEFKINFETGIDDSAAVIAKAVDLGIVSKGKPGWYNFGDNSYRAVDLAPAIRQGIYETVFEKDFPKKEEETIPEVDAPLEEETGITTDPQPVPEDTTIIVAPSTSVDEGETAVVTLAPNISIVSPPVED